MRKWFVYVDYRLDLNEPFYVGKGDVARVARKERNRYHSNIVKKHGSERLVVHETFNERDALDVEIDLIRQLRTRNYFGGANFTDGGDGVSGMKHNVKSIEKNRSSHVGTVHSIDSCSKRSSSMKNSTKVRRKQVKQLTLHDDLVAVHPSVCAAARSLGKPDAATLVSRCCRNKVSTFSGFKWEYVDCIVDSGDVVKRKQAIVRHVVQLNESTDEQITHTSIADAARSIGRNNVSIRACCHGKRDTAYGFKWKFVD